MALPTLSQTIDDQFVSTWYEIRETAIDNILDATVMWLALREHNCLTPQVGGAYITRTIKYGTKSGQNISKGTTLRQGVEKRETMAMWDWAYAAIDVNRTLIDDQKNSGPSKIKDYVTTRLNGSREDLVQKLEEDLFCWAAAFTDQMNGLFDILPCYDQAPTVAELATYGLPTYDAGTPIAINPQYNSGEFGGISRDTNSWWRPIYPSTAASNPATTLRDTMNTMFNKISANVSAPNFIICDQDLYEYYEEELMDKMQVVRTGFNKTAGDMGFETTTFKGKPMTWTAKLDGTDKMMFLNLDYIELVYDPNYFFDMTEWFTTPSQLERVAYIISAMQLIDSQPRRHGLLDFNSSSNA